MSRYLNQNTAGTIVIGPLFDWADSKTLLSDALGGNANFDPADLVCTLFKGTTSEVLTLSKTGGINDMNLVDGGMATIELTAANCDTEGYLAISLTNATTGGEIIFPCSFEFTVSAEGEAPPTYINLSYADVNAAARYYACFNGIDGYIQVADDDALDIGTGDFTICFWIKIAAGAGNGQILEKRIGPGYNIKYTASTKTIALVFSDVRASSATITSAAITEDEWYFVAFTVDRDGYGISYVNAVAGTPAAITALSNGTLNNAFGLNVGTWSGTTFLKADFDDLRIYKAAILTQPQLNIIYNSGTGTQTPGTPIPDWQMGFDTYTGDVIRGIKSNGFELNATKTSGVALVAGGVPFIDGLSLTANIEQALYYLLSQNPDLASVIVARLYPAIVPKGGALPCITYQQISGIRDQELEGASGFVTARFQINCWAKTYGGSRQLSELVRRALAGQSGYIQGKYIHDIQLEDENDMPQIDPESEIISRYGKRLDFQVFFQE